MRERKKLAVDVAAATNLAVSTVTRLLKGETNQPRWDTLVAIARFLELDLEQVMEKAYGHAGDVPWSETWMETEKELVTIYRKLSEEGQGYLMSAALSFLERQRD
jgi:transcriptional regulator with XRE-family HTH domain